MYPIDRNARARAGLLPLFEPYVEVNGEPAQVDPSALFPAPDDPELLPKMHLFKVTTDTSEAGTRAQLHNIVCQRQYSAFSPEVRDCITLPKAPLTYLCRNFASKLIHKGINACQK